VLLLPLKVSYKIAIFFADIYYIFAKEDKKNLKRNLSIVLNTNDKKILKSYIRNIFRNFAKYLVDFFRFSKLSREEIEKNIEIEGKENVDVSLASGKGVILLAAHIGNWELGGAVVASFGYPFYAIALDHKDRRINDFFLKQRRAVGVKVISVGAQLKTCFRALCENSLLGIVGDRIFSNHGIKANFFGRPAMMPRGPAAIALRTGANIVPCFLIRKKDDSFKFIIEKPIINNALDSKKDAIRNTMEKYIPVIERYIKHFPDQWYAFRDVWAQ